MGVGKTITNATEGLYLSQRRVAQSKLLKDDDYPFLQKVKRSFIIVHYLNNDCNSKSCQIYFLLANPPNRCHYWSRRTA